MQRDQTITTDGPYAEVKEQLGGFFIIEAENLDQAIEWAAKPAVQTLLGTGQPYPR